MTTTTPPRRALSKQLVSRATTRRVWAALTRDPQASYRELAEQVGVQSKYTVRCAVIRLRDIGYIEFAPGRERARRVLVPFVEA